MRTIVFALTLLFSTSAFAQIDQIKLDIEYLADDARKGRGTGSKGLVDSQKYIVAALDKIGVPTFYQPVKFLGIDCNNLIAYIDGTHSETYIVVCAHLDHLGIRRGKIMNGADDNASGSAVLLELARRFQAEKPARSVVFVWFTAEEIGIIGSRVFCKNPFDGDFDKDNALPVFALNLDMLGHLDTTPSVKRSWPKKDLAEIFKKYDFATSVTYRGGRLPSDNRSFVTAKVPVITINTDGSQLYHTPADDADTLDYPGVRKLTNYAFDLAVQVSGRAKDYKIWGLDK